MFFVFPETAKDQPWWEYFKSKHTTFTTTDNLDRAVEELASIILSIKPYIIHSHFEGYDVPVVKAIKRTGVSSKIVWHMHDVMSYHHNIIKHIYQHRYFFRHYCLYGRNVSTIGVSKQILDFASYYRGLLGGRFNHCEVIGNGIDFSRIKQRNNFHRHTPFTFLTFGGRNIQKRIDLLLEAASELQEKYAIRVLITNGIDTKQVVEEYFNGAISEWCKIIPQSDDVNSIFEQADCFVSTSIHETFSYAICEASAYGLPVIQSDIEGTKWNAKNPAAFLFHSENVEDLTRAMQEVIVCDKDILWRNIQKTRENNVEKYSIDAWCDKIIEFYKQL